MEADNIKIGALCVSKSGRDKGRHLVVVEVIDDQYVLVADGTLRKLSNPKKKKLKHLHVSPRVLTAIAEKLTGGKKVFDAELKNAISNAVQITQKEE